jgi:hypothetical protein
MPTVPIFSFPSVEQFIHFYPPINPLTLVNLFVLKANVKWIQNEVLQSARGCQRVTALCVMYKCYALLLIQDRT